MMNIIKIIKKGTNKVLELYKASKSFQIGVKIASIFAMASIEQKSTSYWKERQRKKDAVKNKTLEDVNRLIIEQKLILNDLKQIRKEKKLRQASKKGKLAYAISKIFG